MIWMKTITMRVELSWDPLVADNVNSSSVPRVTQHYTWLLLLAHDDDDDDGGGGDVDVNVDAHPPLAV